MKWLALSAVLLGLALCAFLFAWMPGEAESGVGVSEEQSSDRVDPASTLLADAEPDRPEEAAGERESVSVADADSGAAGCWLLVEVVDPKGAPVAGAQVALMFGGNVSAVTNAGGKAAIVASSALETAPAATDLWVTVEHAGFLPGKARTQLSPELRQAKARGTREEVTVRVELRPIGCRVRGRVSVPDGIDSKSVVVAITTPGPRSARATASAHTTCDSEGEYELPVEKPASYTIIAFDDGDELLPAHVTLSVPRGESEAPTIDLATGHVLRGELRLASGEPLAGTISVTSTAEGRGSLIARGIQLRSVSGQYRHHWRAVHAGDNGEFEVRGLQAGEYELTWSSKRLTHYVPVMPEPVLVPVPQQEFVKLVVDHDLMKFRITSEGERLRDVKAKLRNSTSGSRWGFAKFGTLVVVDHPELAAIEFSKSGYKTRVISRLGLRTSNTDWIEVELERGEEPADLTLVLRGDENLTADVFRMSQWRFEDGRKVFLGRLKRVPRGDSHLVMEGFDPGSYAFDLEPAYASNQPGTSYVLPVSCEVVLPPGKSVTHEVQLMMGGRLQVHANTLGYERGVTFELLNSRGETVPLAFSNSGAKKLQGLSSGKVSEVQHALPAGNYIAVVSGFEIPTNSHALRIEVGKTTRLFAKD